MIDRINVTSQIRAALRRSQIVLLLGPRQCGKTTLARAFVSSDSGAYFDLESPDDLARMSQPMTALAPLRGTVVIDEVQRIPDLFPLLRVLADRKPLPARFLVLGSASPEMLRQSSESLAGRVEIVQLGSFTLAECGANTLEKRWIRGGFPRAFLSRSANDSSAWMTNFISTLSAISISTMPVSHLGLSGGCGRCSHTITGRPQTTHRLRPALVLQHPLFVIISTCCQDSYWFDSCNRGSRTSASGR